MANLLNEGAERTEAAICSRWTFGLTPSRAWSGLFAGGIDDEAQTREEAHDADRLHPRTGSGLSDHRHSAAARRDTGSHRGRRSTRYRHHSGNEGIEHVAPFAGLDGTTFTVASNTATIFSGLPSLYNHDKRGVTAITVLADLRRRLSVIKDAHVLTIPPPPVQGLGSAGGFKLMLEDGGGLGSDALVKAAKDLVAAANKESTFARVARLVQRRLAIGHG